MNSRTKKYFTDIKAGKKQVDNNTGSDKKKEGKQKPFIQKNTATQDDTGGSNDSGKRSDDN